VVSWNSFDHFATHLKSKGYSPVRHPKSTIRPLDLLWRTPNGLGYYSYLADVFVNETGKKLPGVIPDPHAGNIGGVSEKGVELGVGMSILKAFLKFLGADLGIGFQYKQAKTLSFSYGDVGVDKISLGVLTKYLATADLDPALASTVASDLADMDQFFFISEVAKCKKISVEAKDDKNVSIEFDIPLLQALAGVNVKIGPIGVKKSTEVTYEGLVPLVFGVKVMQLYYQGEKFENFKPVPPEDGMLEIAPTKRSLYIDLLGY
jgi:hypothetical protein